MISDDVREQAALICAIAASTPELSHDYEEVCEQLDDVSWRAHCLALEAWGHALHTLGDQVRPLTAETAPLVAAEAEALIRTGWVPGGES